MVVTTKILLEIPLLYDEIIYDEFVSKRKYKSRKDFIISAIKEKFEKARIDLVPKTKLNIEDWWDFKDDPKIYKKEGVTSHERE